MYVSGIIFKSKKLISVLLAAVLCFALFMFIQSFTAKESSDDVKEDAAVYELQLEDGVWKVLREEVKTHLMEGDQAKEQQFDTLGDAVSYADSTTPSNVF